MNAHSTLRPSASSPSSVEGPSAMMSPALHQVADLHQRTLVDAGVLVRALELQQVVDVDAGRRRPSLLGRADDDAGARRPGRRCPSASGDDRRHRNRAPPSPPCRCRPAAPRRGSAAPPGAACSSPSARGWRRRSRGTGSAPRRPRRAASATRRSDRSSSGRHSTKSPFLRQLVRSSTMRPCSSICDIGLGDRVAALVHRREIDDLVGDLAVVDLAVRALDEAVLVDPGIGRERC